MSNEEFVNMLRKLVEIEKEYAKKLENTANKAENIAVKTLLKAIALDSLKHSMMYESLVKGLSNPDLLTKAEAEAIIGELEYHIETEVKFIKYIQDKLNQPINETAKFILQTILKDEVYHHQLLYNIKELVIKRHKMLDTALWEIIWKELMKQ